MGYKDFQNFDGATGEHQENTITLEASAARIELPDASYVKDAELSRDGMDLVLDGPNGQIVIDGYFAQVEGPTLHAPDGSSLNANLVNSFVKSSPVYADFGSMNDESPVGAVHEVTGSATVTRIDGSSETIQLGTPIYQGDIIETAGDGAVNVMFIDETSFAVSEDARLAIDEYVFDPASSEGVTNFSVLKGVFVFTSGLIGREDPDDVNIETPVGSIGIRGTIIAGDVDTGEITVIEGAIVLRDAMGNEMTLANQFETAQFDTANGTINNMGQMAANDVASKFSSVSGVSAQLFSSINDVAQGQSSESGEMSQERSLDANNDGVVDGTVDQNGDGTANGTVEGAQDGETDGTNAVTGSDDQSDASDAAQDGSSDTQTASTDGQPSEAPAPAPIQSATAANGGFGSGTTTTTSSGSSGSSTTTTTTSTSNIGTTTLQAKASTTQTNDTTTQTRTAEATRTTDTNTTTPDPTPVPGGGTVTPFVVSVVLEPSIYENEMGAKIATLSADRLDISSVELFGIYSHMFEIRPSMNTTEADIFLRSGYALDYETASTLDLEFTATSLDGTENYTNGFTFNVIDMDDPAVYTSFYAYNSDPQVGAGQTWSYDFSQQAYDEDIGDTPEMDVIITAGGTTIFDSNINTYLDPSIQTILDTLDIASINFDPAGTLTISIAPTMTGDHDLIIQVYMNGMYQENVSFDYFNPTGTIEDGIVNDITNNTFAVTTQISAGVTLIGTNGTVTFSDFADAEILVETIDSFINAGGGNDLISIESGYGNHVSGGSGDDFIVVKAASNFVYGGTGNDEIIINFENGDVLGYILTSTSATSRIDGGLNSTTNPFFINFDMTVAPNGQAARTFNGHGDRLRILDDNGTNYGNLIDFTAMADNQIITNIEILDINNGDANNVILNKDNVFYMTDDNNTLVIRGDQFDTLSFDTLGFGYTNEGVVTDNLTGDSYNVFVSTGVNVTLLVDTDIATMIDGVAV